MASSTLSSIEKLKGRENYETWKFAVRAFLEMESLWGYVDNTATETNEEKKKKGDTMAKAKLILLVEPINYAHIQNATSAKEVWDSLKNAFDDSGLLRRVGLLRTLITTSLESSSSIEEYVNKIITTAHKLKGAGMTLDDEWIATLLLAGLSNEYKPMIMAIESSGVKISSDQIKTKLLQEVNSNVQNSGSSAALYSKNFRPQSQSQVKCFKCKKVGHYQNKCPLKNSDNKTFTKKNDSKKGQNYDASLTCFVVNQCKSNDWIIDSGATAHMTNKSEWLTNVKQSATNEVTIADDTKLKVPITGDVKVKLNCANRNKDVDIRNVLYVPGLCTNLLSVSTLVQKGLSVNFNSDGCRVIDRDGELLAEASMMNGMFKLSQVESNVMTADTKKASKEVLWHRRLGHIGFDNLKRLKSDFSDDLQFDSDERKLCGVCLEGKQSRKPFNSSSSRSSKVLELVHSDVCGPINVDSFGGSRYFVTFLDDFSRKVVVYIIKQKSDVFAKLKEYKCMAENQTGEKLKVLRTDNGTEYFNKNCSNFLKDCGIVHQSSAPYTPEQNGMAERMNRTLVEKARCMLLDGKLSIKFWAEAINTAAYIVNRSPSRVISNKTPEEMWSGVRPELSHFRVFGCKAMMHVPKEKRKKFDPKSIQCIMVGYSETSKAYRLFDSAAMKTIISRDVVFLEDERCDNVSSECTASGGCHFYFEVENSKSQTEFEDEMVQSFGTSTEVVASVDDPQIESADSIISNEQNGAGASAIENGSISSESESSYDSYDSCQESSTSLEEESDLYVPPSTTNLDNLQARRSSRNKKPTDKTDFVSYLAVNAHDPVTVEEALSSPNASKWQEAMEREYESLLENRTWSLVNLPPDRKPINCKWVFKTKCDSNGVVNQHKARLVVKGCAQRQGIDYEETFSPVVRYASIRFLISMAAKHNLQIDQMDAVTAFLQGELQDEIYMIQPQRFDDGTQKVCRLKKSLYGLKQASRIWNHKLNAVLIKFGLCRSKVDECIYYRVDGRSMLIVAVYVDDILIFSNDVNIKNKLKRNLQDEFKMKDIGAAKFILGMEIIRNKTTGSISINQSRYIRQILEKFGMADSNPVKTAADVNQKLTVEMCPNNEESRKKMDAIPYQEAVGSILFVAQLTRPDIQYAVNSVSRFNQTPGMAHWLAVKRIMRYLKGTIHYKLTYHKNGGSEMHGYCDSDWAADSIDRRSTTGYVFMHQGGAISWGSKKQPTVALSTTEAEYMAMSSATQEALWLKSLSNEIFQKKDKTLIIKCDNKGAIQLSEKSSYQPRTKHIDVRHHFIREKVIDGNIKFEYIKTDFMLADYLTKPVPDEKNVFCCNGNGVK